MKINMFFLSAALAVMAFSGCKSTQPTVVYAQQTGDTPIELPCEGFDRDSQEYFTGMGIGENVNMQNARNAAFDAAKGMVLRKMGGVVKGISTDYSRSMAGNARQDDVQRMVESELTTAVEKTLNDAEKTCEKMFQTNSGTYRTHMAIQISKKALVDQMSKSLSENDKLQIEFNREQFRKWAEQRMKMADAK